MMQRSVLPSATFAVLAIAVAVLKSAQPAGQPCSIADLDYDCDVDLKDFAILQEQTSGPGEPVYDPVGSWDVFRVSETGDDLMFHGLLSIHSNGTVQGQQFGGDGGCGGSFFTRLEVDDTTLSFEYACGGHHSEGYLFDFSDGNTLTGTVIHYYQPPREHAVGGNLHDSLPAPLQNAYSVVAFRREP